jgi:alkylation response protein AidB-like acyl-CoA dehydrogenase
VTAAPTAERRDDADLGADITKWLQENWDPDLTVGEWWQLVGESGWTAPHFPIAWGGRGYSRRSPAFVRAAFEDHRALPAPGGLGLLMAAPTILSHGTPEQIERFVPAIYTGQHAWCQLFSEPGSGSDLASLSTRAVRDGDRWIISGQKVWSSMAVGADHGMLLARTDPSVAKHAGISWFAFSLEQPGVEVRPLVEITGHSLFNEVFIDEAVVDDADLIGGLNNGWAVTQTTLMFERTGIGAGGMMRGFPPAGPKGGFLGRRAGDAVEVAPPPTGSKVLSFQELIELAREYGRAEDPLIRQKLAHLATYVRAGEWTARRSVTQAAKSGGGGFANLGKLAQSRIAKLSGEIGCDILGPAATLWDPDGPVSGRYPEALVFACASSIYGGTDEVQKNVIGERVLGLPREPDPLKGIPFAELSQRSAELFGNASPTHARSQGNGSRG